MCYTYQLYMKLFNHLHLQINNVLMARFPRKNINLLELQQCYNPGPFTKYLPCLHDEVLTTDMLVCSDVYCMFGRTLTNLKIKELIYLHSDNWHLVNKETETEQV